VNKTIYRFMGIIVTLALVLGGFSQVEAISDQPAASSKPVYAYYYLWWSTKHWQDKLGPNYPYNASPLPFPATTDADGCNPVSGYSGNQLLDVPTRLVSQDEPGAIEDDIRLAKNAGLTGFWLNWSGDGTISQKRTTVTYTRRLSEAFAASKRVGGFKNWVSYKAASRPSPAVIINDLNFLYKEFKDETAWERIDGKPVVTFTGSREYSDAEVQMISNAVRDRMYLVGDESRKTLTPARMAMFDAITYYWSTQDPYGNPQSFDQIKEMGDMVHAAGKKWYAPLNPGYNSKLLDGSGTCIPRKNGDTLRTVWNGNLASNPDGWGMISWNEIAENTHIKPMQKWGNTYLNVLSLLIGPPKPPAPPPTTMSIGTYDNADPALSYSGGWSKWNGTGPYAGTMHYTNVTDAKVIFKFKAPARFILFYQMYSNRSNIMVSVDGEKPVAVNAYSATNVWQKTYTSAMYSDNDTHTVTISTPGDGKYIDIDAIKISNSSASLMASAPTEEVATLTPDSVENTLTPVPGSVENILDDNNAAFVYSSSAWQDQFTDKAYGGSYKETTRSGSFITLPFSGQSFSIIYKGGVTYGKMHVYVDDVLVATLDQKLSESTYQKRWDYPDQLASGDHTLRLVFEPASDTVNKGSLDAVIIR
jgi:hypothetical protein